MFKLLAFSSKNNFSRIGLFPNSFNLTFNPQNSLKYINHTFKTNFAYFSKCGFSNYNYNFKRANNNNNNFDNSSNTKYDSSGINRGWSKNIKNTKYENSSKTFKHNKFSNNSSNNINRNNHEESDPNHFRIKANYDVFRDEKMSKNTTYGEMGKNAEFYNQNHDFEDNKNSQNRNRKEVKAFKLERLDNEKDTQIQNYNKYMTSKYYMEKNMPETFQSNNEKFENEIKDPFLKKTLKADRYSLSFNQFGFLKELYTVLDKLEFLAPTSIQNVAIPKILEKKNIFFASQTGMGKTLAYVLPILNDLKLQELQFNQRLTMKKRPRALILAPSRELCQQIEEVIKLFVFDLPIVVESFYVGKPFITEKKYALNGIDILISTPDRFRNHWSKNNIFITKLTHLVVDELDTFLDAGYGDFIEDLSMKLLKNQKQENSNYNSENNEENTNPLENEFSINHEEKFIKKLERKVNNTLNNHNPSNTKASEEVNKSQEDRINETNKLQNSDLNPIKDKLSSNQQGEKEDKENNNNNNKETKKEECRNSAQLIYVSTTLTKSIERFLDKIFYDEVYKTNRAHSGDINFVKIIDKSTNHNLSNIKHEFLQVTDFDKYPTLLKILNDNKKILKLNYSIILFVNSITCARKTELFLAENGFQTSCLHGEIPPLRRKYELDKFKKRKSKILVCTDLIARGLDFPFVYLVINFDFPSNISDYIHRAGRTGRAGRKGFVISFFRKYNVDLINEIKKSNDSKTPLLTEGSMFSKNNKENLKKFQTGIKKRLSHGLINKSLHTNNDSEKKSLIDKLKKRKEKIDKLKAKMIEDKKEKIRVLNKKYNSRHRNTNRNNKYGLRFGQTKKK